MTETTSPRSDRSALVTGASTGIGEATTRRLAADGWTVLAGGRRREDAERLGQVAGVRPIICEVTSVEGIAAAQTAVDGFCGGQLDVLVNNAGVAVAAPVETLPLDLWREHLEVNVLGPVALIQALLRAVLRAKGRIVNVTSISGQVAQPTLGAYAASKHAMEAASDSLRRELRSLGIAVIVVETGTIATPMWARGLARMDALLAGMTESERQRYGGICAVMRRVFDRAADVGLKSEAAAELIEAAIGARRPRARYRLGTDAHLQYWIERLMPTRLADATFDRLLRATR